MFQLYPPLLDQGAEVDARNNRGETPLHIACTRNLAEVVHYFMRLGEVFLLGYIDSFVQILTNSL